MEMLRVSVDDMQKQFRKIAIEAKAEIKSLFSQLHTDDIDINIVLREGTPSKEILELSKKLDADLIVMGTNGKDNISDYLLGTTSENVISNSICAVLVVPMS